jgi:hypothetical protein
MDATEKKANKIPAATVLTVIAAFLGGGFAGSVFTWYVNRPQATVVTYTVSTTSLGTSEVSSVVPNLKLQIGTENVESIYTHTVELAAVKGPFVDQAEFALTLPSDVRVFGMRTDVPTTLHTITCIQTSGATKCKLGPLSSKVAKPFKVVLATNSRDQPNVELAAKNTDLVTGAEYLRQTQGPLFLWNGLEVALAALVFLFAGGFVSLIGTIRGQKQGMRALTLEIEEVLHKNPEAK